MRHARAQRTMTAASVVVRKPLFQNGSKVRLRDRNQPIQAFVPYCPNHALIGRVRFRTRHRLFQYLQTEPSYRVIEVLDEYSVAVMEQIPMGAPLRRRPPVIAATSIPPWDWPSRSASPTLQSPEDSRTESVPAHDGRGPDVHDRVMPIAQR